MNRLIKLIGVWDYGYAFDTYVLSSKCIEDEFGNRKFDNTYSEIGESLYALKYCRKKAYAKIIADSIYSEIQKIILEHNVDLIIPIPPTNDREFQPVFEVCKCISELTDIPYNCNILSNKTNESVKNILPQERRSRIRIGVNYYPVKPVNILLMDDYYQTGSTAAVCVSELRKIPNVKSIIYFSIVKNKNS